MMKYDFDKIIERRGTDSLKWEASEDPEMLPLWVADMDFCVAPAITEAIRKRAEHCIYGYSKVPQAYYDAIIGWFGKRHGWEIRPEWIGCCSGVIPSLAAIISHCTEPDEKVLIQTPVYDAFISIIQNCGREIVTSPLKYRNDTYIVDFEDLERKASDEKVTLMLLSNPHNPAGRVLSREELQRIGEICIRHGVLLVSDEIHCELTAPGVGYTPLGSVSEEIRQHCVSCISPTKSFNIAGLKIANVVVANSKLRRKVMAALVRNRVADVNPFGIVATIAAYTEGGEWIDQLNEYIASNYKYMKEFCRKQLPQFSLLPLEGTYLVWMDCSSLGIPSEELAEKLKSEAHLWLNAGIHYGEEGDDFLRWNIACPRSVLERALHRFMSFVRLHLI